MTRAKKAALDTFVLEMELDGKIFRRRRIRLRSGFTLRVRQRDIEDMQPAVTVSGYLGDNDITLTVDAGGKTRLKKRTRRRP